MWVVSEKLGLFAQDDSSGITGCSHYCFKKGDFVDVTFVVEILMPAGSRDLTIKFCMKQVVQLKARAFISKVSNVPRCTL